MSLPGVVILVVALVTLAMFVIITVALIRQISLLGRTIRGFMEAVTPALEEITAGAERAADRSQALQRR
ncbi:MAG: hypothetical protein WD757_02060 [Actinomycetota bacterium]